MIRAAGGEPSSKTGAFREKVMALDTIESRLELLNRGQGWVAKRIDELLPSVTDPGFQAELVEMRERHHANIAACEAALQRLRAAGT
jgi:nitronate monooxygenase